MTVRLDVLTHDPKKKLSSDAKVVDINVGKQDQWTTMLIHPDYIPQVLPAESEGHKEVKTIVYCSFSGQGYACKQTIEEIEQRIVASLQYYNRKE